MKKHFVLIFIFSVIISNNVLGAETEGEASMKRIKKIFKKEYSFHKHDKYAGLIESSIEGTTTVYRFEDKLTVALYAKDSVYNTLFAEGILCPSLLGGSKERIDILLSDSITVCNFENLSYTNPSPSKRRFSIWVFTKGLMNPNLFVFELTNNSAKRDTELSIFLKDSYLSYVRYGWFIIYQG